MKYDVFISYSSLDQKVAEGVCAYLEQHRIRCFIAYRDIPKGVVWASAIVEALDESRMMVVVFSSNFNCSEQVDREIELASDDKKPILTFRISNDAFKGAKKYYLKNLNWIDAFPQPEQCFGNLCENVHKLLGIKESMELAVQYKSINTNINQSIRKEQSKIDFNPIDREEQYNLGCRYQFGDGIPQDADKAFFWYCKAAVQGHVTAQNKLAECYMNGDGIEYDSEEAVHWYRKAAEQGLADAQCNLGNCCYMGIGVSKDWQQAVYWYRKAAEQDHAKAQNSLGECYRYGMGVDTNLQLSFYWYRKAAEQGLANAQTNLGECYQEGLGVKKDLQQALYWYRKAAAQGYVGVLYNLGECYQFGLGIGKDLEKAVYLYRKAAQKGVKRAQNKLNELGKT